MFCVTCLTNWFSRPSDAKINWRQWLWAACFCWVGLGYSGEILAKDLILERAFWSDTSGQATFEQAREATYTPYSTILSRGYSHSADWVRLKIDGVSDHADLVLQIRPIFLDQIELYSDSSNPDLSPRRVVGDRWPLSASEAPSPTHHAFAITASAEPFYLWLRLNTTSAHLMHVEVRKQSDVLPDEMLLWALHSLLISLIISTLAMVGVAWTQSRDRVNGLFVLRQTVLLVFTVWHLGYHRVLLPEWVDAQTQDALFNVLVITVTLLSVFYEYTLLQEYEMPAWGRWLMRLTLGLCVLPLALLTAGETNTALHMNMLINLLSVLSLPLISITMRATSPLKKSTNTYQLPLGAVIFYHLMIISVVFMTIFSSLGLLAPNMLAIYGIPFYGLVSGLLMGSLLIYRSHHKERIRQDIAHQLHLSSQQLAAEARRREDQSALLSMLMHELKNPLSVIEMATIAQSGVSAGKGYVNRAVASINSTLEKCIQVDQMVDGDFRLEWDQFDLSAQLKNWLEEVEEADGRLTCQITPGLWVRTDVHCLDIVVKNLVINALRHGDANRPIDIQLSASADGNEKSRIWLTVRNHVGPSGLPDVTRLFAKYYRADAAKKNAGTGLGLYLSCHLIQRLGGELSCQVNEPLIEFTLWIPS